MELPVVPYRELAAKYGVELPECGETVTGIRIGGAAGDGLLHFSPSLPSDLLNEAIELTERCISWFTSLDMAIEKGAAPQELIDLSAHVLNEPVFLVDPSMKRIAATDGMSAPDVFFTEIVQQGYPSLDTYERLNRGNYYDPHYYTGAVMHLVSSEEVPRDVALRGIRLQGKLAATAIMICQNSAWSEGKAALFSCLTDRLAKSLESPWVEADTHSEQYDFLLRELLDGKKLAAEEIASRLRFTGRGDPCPCHAVLFSEEESSTAKLGYVCRVLGTVFPGTRPLIYGGRVLTLLPVQTGKREEALDRLESFCKCAGCYCGVSAPIRSLAELPEAYAQAEESAELGRRLAKEGTWFSMSGEDRRVRTFCHDEYAAYRVIRAFGAEHALMSLCRPEFLRIDQYDRENGTDNLRILFCFLCGHMNYTEAARRLFMHRNSVFYRIERICELIGVDSIDDTLEQGLRFSYMVQDIQHLSEFSTK